MSGELEAQGVPAGPWVCRSRGPSATLRGRVHGYRAFSATLARPLQRLEVARGLVTLVIGFGAPLRVDTAGRTAPEAFDSFLIGPDHAPVITEHRGARTCIEVSAPPWVAYELFDGETCDLADLPVAVDAVLGKNAGRLGERIANATAWAERFALLDAFLAGHAARARRRVRSEIRWAWEQLERTNGTLPVGSVAARLGWSHRHFVACFREHTGLTPKTAARRLRLAHAVRLLEQAPELDLGSVAARCAYSDQSHLTREFQELAHCTPGAYRHHLRTGATVPGTSA